MGYRTLAVLVICVLVFAGQAEAGRHRRACQPCVCPPTTWTPAATCCQPQPAACVPCVSRGLALCYVFGQMGNMCMWYAQYCDSYAMVSYNSSLCTGSCSCSAFDPINNPACLVVGSLLVSESERFKGHSGENGYQVGGGKVPWRDSETWGNPQHGDALKLRNRYVSLTDRNGTTIYATLRVVQVNPRGHMSLQPGTIRHGIEVAEDSSQTPEVAFTANQVTKLRPRLLQVNLREGNMIYPYEIVLERNTNFQN
jgi:hypothetical protein